MPEVPVGAEHAAVVTVVDQVLHAGSGTFGVRLRVENAAGAIPSGVHCRVRFVGGGSAAVR